MQKQKLRLDDLKVKSFITSGASNVIIGGTCPIQCPRESEKNCAVLTVVSALPHEACHPCYTVPYYCPPQPPPPAPESAECSYVGCVTVVVGCPTMAQTPIPCYV